MFKTLLKIRLRAMFSGTFKIGKAGAKRSVGFKILIGIFAAYIVACLFGMFGGLFLSLCGPFCAAGLNWLYFSLAGVFAFVLCFIGSVFMTQSVLFESKDNEMLLAMPVKPAAILGSRVTALLALNYLFTAFVMLPAIVIYCATAPVNVLTIVFFILSFLLLPLLSMTLSCLFGWLLALINTKMRKKNLAATIFSILFLVAYFYVFSRMQEYLNYLVANGGQIGAAIQKTAYPIYHMGLAIAEGNALSMLIFVLCCAVPFGLVYLILSSNFIRIATSSGGAAKVKYREKALRVSGVRSALTKKELRHFLSNPMYIMNAALGSVISVLLAGFAVFQLSKLTDAVSKIGLNVPIAALAAFMLAMCAGMNFISAPSVSLEGKNLWISRSIPAASRDVLESKAMAHFIAGLPSILISGAVFDILLHPDPLAAVCMFLLPLSVNALTAYMGVAVNLKFPRMDWISDVQAVKQSMSTMICMFGSMAIVIAPVLLYAFLLTGILGSDLFVLICAALFTAVAALLRAYLHRGGSAVFESL